MWKLALCLCVVVRLARGQIDGYADVSEFSCENKIAELVSRTAETGSIQSPCYNVSNYPKELTSGLKLVNITYDSPFVHGYELTIINFQLAESDRLYIGPVTTSSGLSTQAARNITLTSNSTTDGKIYVQEVEDGPITQTLTLNTDNKLLLVGYVNVFMDFYTVDDTLGGEGFLINYTVDINKCLFTGADVYCKNGGNCTRTGLGTASCSCTSFWTGDTCAQDINECALNTDDCDDRDVPAKATCTNIDGGFNCACKDGYSGDGKSCADIDECSTKTDDCHDTFATCTNNNGSFVCACNMGFTGNGINCDNINECDTVSPTHNCHSNATCTDNTGSFTCACKDGFSGVGTACTDNDECVLNSDDCHTKANCTNTVGGYLCTCIEGFTGTGQDCTDIDECGLAGSCDTNAACNNTESSFTCVCNSGWTGDGKSCTDINECSAGAVSAGCHADADCLNIDGSFNCACKPGYTGDGRDCTDVDECTNPTICHNDATCANTPAGTYTCTCNGGYTGNGTACADIDECALSTHGCTTTETTCSNLVGGFECICNNPVYRGTPGSCEYYCDHNTTCILHKAGFIDNPLYAYVTAGNYIAFDETFWNFDGTRNGIRFTFKRFSTEKRDDFLSIYPGDSAVPANEIVAISGELANLYNRKDPVTTSGYIQSSGSSVTAYLDLSGSEPTLTLSSSNVYVAFTSDRLNTSTGFILQFEYDIDDCTTPTVITCEHSGTCDDRPFAYQCINCPGWTGINCETDIDECETPGRCAPNATCTNSPGSHTCVCNADYTGSGTTCNQYIVFDNLNVVKTTTSLTIDFDITSVYRTIEYIVSFVITIVKVSGGSSQTIELLLSELPITIPNLEIYTQYNVSIAINSTGSRFGSSIVVNSVASQLVFTAQSTPATPTNFVTNTATRDRVTLTWQKPTEEGFGKVTHYEICYAPNISAIAVATLRGLSTADNCLILDDTYTSITLTKLFSYIDLSFKIRAFSSEGPGNFTDLVVAYTGKICDFWTTFAARATCPHREGLLLSQGFPQTPTSSDNNIIRQQWSFDLTSFNEWRLVFHYFQIVTRESALDYGFGDFNIIDHDIERAKFVEEFTGTLASGARAAVTKNTSISDQNLLWFAYISDRTRKEPGFQVEVERNGDNCDSTPCLHSGVCTNGAFSYTCDCTATDWTGTSCEEPHIRPTVSCVAGKRDVAITFNVQNRWSNDETVIKNYTVALTSGGSSVSSMSKPMGDSSAAFPGLTPFTSYTATVTVMPSLRQNAMYATGSVTCDTLEDVPTEPRNVVVTPSGTNFVVTWDAPSAPNGVVTYIVTHTSTDHGTYSEAIQSHNSASISTTTYTIPGSQLRLYRTYDVTVKASTSAGSMSAAAVSERTNPGAPPAFLSATVTVITNRSARVEWDLGTTTFAGPVTITIAPESDMHTPTPETVQLDFGSTMQSTVYALLEEAQIYNFTLTASTGTAPDRSRMVTNVNTNSIAPGMTATFVYDSATSTFSWTPPGLLEANGVITGYVLKAVSTVPGFTQQTFPVTNLTFQLQGLPVYTRYTFSLQAINDAGVGMEHFLNITTKEAVPDTPGSVTQGATTPTSITVSWPIQDPAVGMTVYILNITGTTSSPLETAVSPATIPNLTPYTDYTITIIARTGAGDASPTAAVTFKTAEAPPTAVQNPQSVYVEPYIIRVSWDEPATLNGVITGYKVSWLFGSSSNSAVETTRTYDITGVTQSETQYNITILATTGGGDGPTSSTTVVTPVLLPHAPRNSTVTTVTAETAEVTADPPANADSIPVLNYIITLNQNETDCQLYGDSSCLAGDEGNKPTGLPFTITGLKPYRRYNLTIAAQGAGGVGPDTDHEFFRTLAAAPNTPSTPITSLVPGGVTVTFNAGSPFTGPASYMITLTVENGDPVQATISETDIVNGLTATVFGLSGSTAYTVSVIATNSAGSSAASGSTSITTTPAAPTVTINRQSSTSLEVSITADTNAVSYTISYIQTACTDACDPTVNTTTETSFVITGLSPFTQYNITVFASSTGGAGSPTASIQRTQAGAASLLDPTYVVSQSSVTDTNFRSAYTVILENLCNTKSTVWDEVQGTIDRVAYIVRQSGSTGAVSLTTYYGQVHADEPSPAYRALTITCTATGRRKREVVTAGAVMGADPKCASGGTTECNGPLKPNTGYTFQACGINEADNFACTDPSAEIKTDPAPPSTGLTAGEIAAIVICSILLLILIILLIVFLVKRRRSHRGKHTVSRRGRDNPTFDTKTSQQKYNLETSGEPRTTYTEPTA